MPVITISRGTMSRGRAVAERLAERLGCPCIGRKILQGAARKLGVSEEDLSGHFEMVPGRWARLTRERKMYLLAVQTALAEHAARGDLVYHGLAGQFLLKGLAGVLRVRLIAPMAVRVCALMEEHTMDPRAAEEFIRNVDHDRRRWVKLMYDADVDDPSLYDLTIHLRSISLETACAVVVEAARQPEYRITDEDTKRLQDFADACREELSAIASGGS